jgi:hypothetical protein
MIWAATTLAKNGKMLFLAQRMKYAESLLDFRSAFCSVTVTALSESPGVNVINFFFFVAEDKAK